MLDGGRIVYLALFVGLELFDAGFKLAVLHIGVVHSFEKIISGEVRILIRLHLQIKELLKYKIS